MKKLLLIFLLLPCVLRGQIITTIAGNGTAGNTGDGEQATLANISTPIGGAFDRHGNYYFVSANTIRKIDHSGTISTVAGTGIPGFSGDNGPATLCELHGPQAVTTDSTGNLFIADAINNRIRKIDIASGIITTIAGTGVAGYNGDSIASGTASLYDPLDLCLDKYGNIYIADHANNRVRKIDATGIIHTIAGTGSGGYNGDGGDADTSEIHGAMGVYCDQSGSIYIAEGFARLRMIDTLGKIHTVAGTGTGGYSGDGGLAVNAMVHSEKVSRDRWGNIYTSEGNNNVVRRIDTNGIITTVAGTGMTGYNGDSILATAAQVSDPAGLVADSCGNLFIADAHNNRIRKISFNPDCSMDNTTLISSAPAKSKIELSPNPIQNELTITAGSNIKELAIINAMGQRVLWQSCNGMKQTVQTGGLSVGVYFVVVRDEHGEVWRGRFVKE
ncbi:MAG: T9SS type A sorting domain-containing protein [Bacteroidetes bacterium]|nr:T9SS type A sorting domain-containing protein [Bacteroidota bacterium]